MTVYILLKNLENVNVNNVYLKEVPDAYAGLYLLTLFVLVFRVANKDIVFAEPSLMFLYTGKGSEKALSQYLNDE